MYASILRVMTESNVQESNKATVLVLKAVANKSLLCDNETTAPGKVISCLALGSGISHSISPFPRFHTL